MGIDNRNPCRSHTSTVPGSCFQSVHSISQLGGRALKKTPNVLSSTTLALMLEALARLATSPTVQVRGKPGRIAVLVGCMSKATALRVNLTQRSALPEGRRTTTSMSENSPHLLTVLRSVTRWKARMFKPVTKPSPLLIYYSKGWRSSNQLGQSETANFR